MDLHEIGKLIRATRDAKQLGLREAAALGGISPTTLSDLEAGKHPPTKPTRRAVAIALAWRGDWYERLQDGDTNVDLSEAIRAAQMDVARNRTSLEHLERLQAEGEGDARLAERIQAARTTLRLAEATLTHLEQSPRRPPEDRPAETVESKIDEVLTRLSRLEARLDALPDRFARLARGLDRALAELDESDPALPTPTPRRSAGSPSPSTPAAPQSGS